MINITTEDNRHNKGDKMKYKQEKRRSKNSNFLSNE